MKSKSSITETVIANSLIAIFERLVNVEKAILALAKVPRSKIVSDAVLLERLDRLTLKRHAVLTATLAGVTYKQIASSMGCDVSTVKIHLRETLIVLGIESRDKLLSAHPDLLQNIKDSQYKSRYGLSKRWWLEQKPQLMAVLRTKKPAANQHTRTKSSS